MRHCPRPKRHVQSPLFASCLTNIAVVVPLQLISRRASACLTMVSACYEVLNPATGSLHGRLMSVVSVLFASTPKLIGRHCKLHQLPSTTWLEWNKTWRQVDP